ncbi:MAG: MerR family transcriptional regulator [Pseudomonadota bacterium]
MAHTKAYRVKDVALITGVSVRTLHYYDELGLLKPTDRTAAGYRLYADDDLLRLQQILIGRSLGLSLEEIRRALDDPQFDYAESLRRQRALLVERLTETHKMIAAVDATLSDLEKGGCGVDFKAVFDGFDPEVYGEEVEARWGDAPQYAESQARTKRYTEADWRAIKAELDAIWGDAAEAMAAGKSVDSAAALAIVERHRLHVCRWFYDLTPEMHVNLADMWEGDARFRKTIEKHGAGLTAWLAPAVRAAAEVS